MVPNLEVPTNRSCTTPGGPKHPDESRSTHHPLEVPTRPEACERDRDSLVPEKRLKSRERPKRRRGGKNSKLAFYLVTCTSNIDGDSADQLN